MSSAIGLSAPGARAHEVQPTVADFEVSGGVMTVALRVNIEALLSGIDLDTVGDTDEAADPGAYDALRALDAAAVKARAPELLVQWNALPLVAVDGAPVEFTSVEIVIPEGVDIEQPRLSDWRLTGALPAGGEAAVFSWPDGAGAIVVRQQGVETPFTGYLDGGQSSEAVSLQLSSGLPVRGTIAGLGLLAAGLLGFVTLRRRRTA